MTEIPTSAGSLLQMNALSLGTEEAQKLRPGAVPPVRHGFFYSGPIKRIDRCSRILGSREQRRYFGHARR